MLEATDVKTQQADGERSRRACSACDAQDKASFVATIWYKLVLIMSSRSASQDLTPVFAMFGFVKGGGVWARVGSAGSYTD